MASESDDSDVEYFEMEQPPLIQQLVTILDEYPDDGQIIKELIQNAEDAGATKMKILYDGRHLTPSTKEKKFDKFVKGPALVFWNNAEFTDADWKGIRMIYSSVKAQDPLKVGRFGLGFKSVFHITDYPVIVSGDRLMLMSPCECKPERVCVTIPLQKLHKCKRLTTDHFLNALQDTFGFTADSMSSGKYSGTMFWFPLRERESNISDTIYKEDKILDLLNSFQSDADSMLLFLNNLQEVAAYVRKADPSTGSRSMDGIDVYDYGPDNPFFSVKLDKNVDEVVQKRKSFTNEIKDVPVHCLAEKSIKSSTEVTFTTQLTRRALDRYDVESKSRTWLVVKYLKGGVMPDRLKTLIQDKTLSYMPCVGVATPLCHSTSFKGHIFCYLPLPQEQQSLTGLPVHVNGFFALSQNRRHLKWPSADQVEYAMHQDKSIDWNLSLIEHVLPNAYLTLLQKAAEFSGETHNLVYDCIPNPEKVEDHWKPLLNEVIYKTSKKKLLYTENNGGTWLSYKDALFIDTQKYISWKKWDSIEEFLRNDKQNVVHAPTHVMDALKLESKLALKVATPAVLKNILTGPNSTYKQLSEKTKLHLLEFLLLDGDLCNVDGLDLLPLQDGTFGTFSATETKYLVLPAEVKLFPGLEDMFVNVEVAATIHDQLQNMSSKGWYGLKRLELAATLRMLKMCISRHFGTNTPVSVRSNKDGRWAVWVMHVWAYISNQFRSHVAQFGDLPIFPVMSTSDWNSMQEFHLHKLTDLIILEKSQASFKTNLTSIPEEVGTVLRMLSIVLVPAIPKWLRSDIVQPFIPDPSPGNVCWLLGKLSIGSAEVFNRNTTDNQRMQLVKYVYSCRISADTKSMMQRLQIFKQKSNKTGDKQWVSIEENNEIVNDIDFPIRYPRRYIVATAEEKQLAKSLGGHTVDQANLAREVLNMIQEHSDRYSQHEIDTFMKWLLMQRFFETNPTIRNLLKNTSFLRTSDGHLRRPCDLFDPIESSLVQLFQHEDKFPADDCYRKGNMLHALRQLGLKTRHQISTQDIQQTAELLDKMAHEGQCGTSFRQKAEALMLLLEENMHILSTCNIKDMCCIPQQDERHPLFPPSLQWCNMPYSLCRPSEIKSNNYSVLIGSIQPVVDCRSLPKLANHFKWNDPPTESQIVSNLFNLVEQYDMSQKAEFVGSIHNIYKELSQRPISKVQMEMTARFKDGADGYIWCGDGFLAPGKIYTESSKSDIELKPYLFLLPTELWKWKSLFLSLGCHQHQDAYVLKNILQQISHCHESGNTVQSAASNYLVVVVNILNKLRDLADTNDIETSDILFPVHMETETRLVMKKSSVCTYSDVYMLNDVQNTDGDDDDDIVFVHGDVPHSTAEKLGVKSLTQQIMSDTEGLEEWGQTEPLTRRLHNLLKEGYVDGFSIPKELFQNADDAGAQKIFFLYDERENRDARTSLINESMSDFQGPALWVYNDAEFSDDDFKNITKIGAGTKKNDSTKIGKFGLGFSSIYNLTDLPSIVSRANFIIFDPHMTYLGKALPGKSPGLKIDLQKKKNLKMMKRLHNQFKPFEGVFGCNLINNEPYFKGTLFRFPLRTYTQAKKSDICQIEYSRQECQKLLTLFLESAGNLMLFNQNIKDLRLYHIPATSVDPSNADLIFSVGKTEFQVGNIPIESESILSTVVSRNECRTLKEDPFLAIKWLQVEVRVERQQLLPNISHCVNEVEWLVSWASGTEENTLSLAFNNVGALPLGSVAVPVNKLVNNQLLPMNLSDTKVGFYSKGHMYCFMPLPVSDTGLPFHVNGFFSVSSDRQRLHNGTEDDKVVCLGKWNESLLRDAVCRSFVYLLDSLRKLGVADQYLFHQLWPLVSAEFVQKTFKDSFYRNAIHTSSKIFERNKVWLSFSQCMFIDQSLRETKEVWDATFEVASYFLDDMTVVDVPQSIYDCLNEADNTAVETKTLTQEQFFVNIFLPHVNSEYFHTVCQKQKRDMLIIYALKLRNTVIYDSLDKSACIPTRPNGILQKPSFLVHQNGQIASLFSVADGRFVESAFEELFVQEQLVERGMMKAVISGYFISDRANSIKPLLSVCGNCAMERCSELMMYLRRVHAEGNLPEEVLTNLKEIPFLPVMDKPENWSLRWHCESTDCVTNCNSISLQCSHSKPKDAALPLQLAAPESLFNSDCVSLVSTLKPVLDREKIDIQVKRHLYDDPFSGLLKDLNITFKDDVPVELVIKQLQNISSDFTKCEKDKVPQTVYDVCTDLYSHMNMMCSGSAQISNVVSELKTDNIICFSDKFVCPNIAAKSVKNKCSPYLYSISDHSLNEHIALCHSLQIKTDFEAVDICNVLVQMQAVSQHISDGHIYLVCNIIAELVYAMERDKIQLDSLCHSCPGVYAPDVNGVLRITTTMCFNDCEDIASSDTMVYIHDKVSLHHARLLGVKTKRFKRLEDTSEEIGFFQNEPLVTRLKGLLSGYPRDTGIFKDLLQNADDAKATELHFIKDYGHHRIVSEFGEPLQGPSLCVYNNGSFTQEDLKGIQSLGTGSKSDDPSKTGQFGVGFNAVYNFTDSPSFLTKGQDIEHGETLCMFDPLAKNVPHTSREMPGRRFVNLNNLRRHHEGMLDGYHEDIFENGYGTMFRFPLRREESEISSHCWTKENLDELFAEYRNELGESLLFLKSVRKITISNIASGKLESEYSVQVSLSEKGEAERKRYQEYQKQFIHTFTIDRMSVLTLGCEEFTYEMNVIDIDGTTNKWFVVQRVGYLEGMNVPEIVQKKYNSGELGLLPQGGVAVCLKEKTPNEERSKAFCCLPLPIYTGLPVHVNGHFALDHEARRSLWRSENINDCHRTQWNISLLKLVVAPCYVTSLKYMKHHRFDSFGDYLQPEEMIIDILKEYGMFFPCVEFAKDVYWKQLSDNVYQQIVDGCEELLPSLQKTDQYKYVKYLSEKVHCIDCTITWTSLNVDGYTFPAYFSNDKDMSASLLSTLQRLGLRLISNFEHIQEAMNNSEIKTQIIQTAMNKSEIKTQILSEDVVIDFLNSFSGSAKDRCRLDVNVPVKETVFNCVEMTKEVLMYCSMRKEFHACLDKLPLLVTNDGILRQLSVQSPVFLTKYCTLFPDDGHKFVNEHLVSLLKLIPKVFKARVFKKINMNEFVKCLNDHNLKPLLSGGDLIDPITHAAVYPDVTWLQQIWNFVYEEARTAAKKKKTNAEENELLLQFEKYVALLGKWALIPISKHNQTDRRYELFSVAKLHMLLDLDSFDRGTPVQIALESMNISSVAPTCLPEPECQLLKKLTANRCDPVRVLTCLVSNCSNLKNLSSAHCVAILKYFADNMTILKQSAEDWWVKENLKQLPLFIREDESSTSLTGAAVFVIPEGIPTHGFSDWAANTGLILLQTCRELSSLYQYLGFLGCELATVIDVYLQHFHSFSEYMNISDLLKHVEFVSRQLLTTDFDDTYSKQQKCLISRLRNLPFVTNHSGKILKASELKNPAHKLFKLFCDEDEFPDKKFQSCSWIEFLKCLGLQKDITDELYLRFAEQIESEGHRSITEIVCKKSKKLIKYLFHKTQKIPDGNSLQQLANVKFVVPFLVDREYSDLHPQMYQSKQMICFAGSVVKAKEYPCWTTANVLPTWAVPPETKCITGNNNWFGHLGCRRQPTKDMIVLHCQNIGEALKQKLPGLVQKQNSLEWIKDLMGNIYNYLMNEEIDDYTRQRLYNVPLVYYAKENEIYPAHQVIVHCSEYDVVKPYLLQAPSDYSQYFDLFTRLGASATPLCHHYAQVLNQIKIECGTQELNPNELICVAEAVRNLLKQLRESRSEDIDLQVDHLYLPNRKHCMEVSSAIVVSDNKYFERCIQNGSSLNYFMGFGGLAKILELCSSQIPEDVGSPNIHSPRTVTVEPWVKWPVRLLKRLENKYHPLLLSEIVKEELDLTCLTTKNTALSDNTESYLHSEDFIQGILRLVQDKLETDLCENEESAIVSSFQNITVLQASDMKTHIMLRNEKHEWELVPQSERSKIFLCSQEDAGDYKLYFETDNNSLHLELTLEFVKFIDKVAGGRLAEHQMLALYILMNKPDEISLFLDKKGISQYDLCSHSSSMPSPIPGSYVPVKYHVFLDNEFRVFTDNDKYVAYEKEDPCLDDENSTSAPTYIYATIISKVSEDADMTPMFQLYKINIGEGESVTVPAYKLYTFLRKPNPERQVALIDGAADQSHSTDTLPHIYKQICRQLTLAWTRPENERSHIIKRLLLKWHPDKNLGNEEYCTKVVQYIQQCIGKLEDGVKLEDSEDETNGFNRQANFTSSRYNTFFTNMNRRSREHRQFYEEAAHCSNDRSRGGEYNFFQNTEREPYHDTEEADRWQRQAKSDCNDAQMALVQNTSPAYNWVCYRCHQAAEKSLKAAWFSKDANEMRRDKKNSHNLCGIAQGLESDELLALAGELSSNTGYDTRMRYPDMHMMPQIPATAYDRCCAEQVCDIAEKIITLVSETYSGC